MLLDDAIEDWGVANRATLSGSDVEMLRRVWSTVRVSDCADLEIGKMEAKDRKNVMILFDKSDRAGVASTLDKVTRWARTQTGPAQTRPGHTRQRASVRPTRPHERPLQLSPMQVLVHKMPMTSRSKRPLQRPKASIACLSLSMPSQRLP